MNRNSGQDKFEITKSTMQKKFKINDGRQAYVEANTLLEPANKATSAQHDQEEIREVSIQLSQIKKKHDEAKKLVILKQEELDRVKKEIQNLELQEQQAEGPTYQVKTRIEQLVEEQKNTNDRIDEENLTRFSYLHMMDRMKKDFIATKILTSDLESSLRSKHHILEKE